MRFSLTLVMTTGLALGLSTALQPAKAQQSAPSKNDAELITNAISAAPAAISKDATVVLVESGGKLRTLRQGQGAFTCIPDDPNTPGHDPICLDRNGLKWFKALLAHESPPEGKVWVGYMLKGSSDPSIDDPYATSPPAGKKWVQSGTTRDDRRTRGRENARQLPDARRRRDQAVCYVWRDSLRVPRLTDRVGGNPAPAC